MSLKETLPSAMAEDESARYGRTVSGAGIFIIRINEVERTSGEVRGEYYNAELGSVGHFKSYFQLFRDIQGDLDRFARPQRSSERRSFQKKKEAHLPMNADLETLLPIVPPTVGPCPSGPLPPGIRERVLGGSCALFFLRVIFRQNASWQGHLYWADQKSGSYFRSVMELAELMDEAVGPNTEEPENS